MIRVGDSLCVGWLCAMLCVAGCADRTPSQDRRTAAADAPAARDDAAPSGTRGGRSRGLDLAEGSLAEIKEYRATWAVIIGIDEYPHLSELESLLFAVNDARGIRDTLRDEFGFAEERIRYLTGGQATHRAIRDAFGAWLPGQQLDDRDALVVFYAGHGLIDRQTKEGYLAAVDSRLAQRDETCISVSWLRDKLQELPCRHKVVILDSCYSGSLFQDKRASAPDAARDEVPPAVADSQSAASAPRQRGGGASAARDDNISFYYQHPAFHGMSAGRFTPVADGLGENRHSVFTSVLLDVLRERANSPRADHAFTFRHLAAEVETRVANALGSRQIPDWGRLDSGAGDFVFRPTVRGTTPRERAAETERYFLDALLVERENLDDALRRGNRREQIRIVESSRRILDSYLTLSFEADLPAEQVYGQVLTWNGALYQWDRALAQLHDDEELKAEWRELREKVAELARLHGPHALVVGRREWLEKNRAATERIERLERTLAEALVRTKGGETAIEGNPEQVKSALPDDAALVHFVQYENRAPKTGDKSPPREPRLVAFIVRPNAPIHRCDLGESAPLVAAVETWRKSFGSGDDGQAAAQVIRQRIWEPLRPYVEQASTIVIAPDGPLNLVPFAALPGETPGSYLIEEHAFASVTAPADLPHLLSAERAAASADAAKVLVVGGIDYDHGGGVRFKSPAELTRAAIETDDELTWFPALPGTSREIADIEATYRDCFGGEGITRLSGSRATVTAFSAQANRHRWVHVATHGYFAPRARRSEGDVSGEGRQVGEAGEVIAGLECGLVFAGVNGRSDALAPTDDGILTALEVSRLDLRNVEFVVLSGCDTAVGVTAPGEGLFGLQRAFQTAGAPTVIASLWKVHDEATRRLMRRFYDNVWNKRMGKLAALREAQLWILRERGRLGPPPPEDENKPPERLPPYFWGGFVLNGDWR